MRFTIAAALLAQALPALAQEDANAVNTRTSSIEVPTLTLSANTKAAIQNAKAAGRQGKEGVKRNRSAMKLRAKKIMGATGAECKPDVGVLSCGMGMYCQSDDASSLGGVCAPLSMGGRKLEDLGNLTLGDYFCVDYAVYYDCDCTAWDADAGSGDFTFTVCYDYTAPYEQQYCFTASSDGSCEISLDGEACTSCEIDDNYCMTFDCENVGMGSGNDCDYMYPYPPISYTCIPPYDPCYICPDGVAYPYADALVNYGYVYSCSDIDYFGQYGILDAETCTYATSGLQSVCCGTGTASPTLPATGTYAPCNICGMEGASVTLPDLNLSLPVVGEVTCGELYAGGMAGMVPDGSCEVVVGMVADTCGCEMPGATDAPTMAPTNATEAPTMVATNATDAPTASPTVGSGAASKLALSAVACATALVAVFSM
eukprot:Nitzschia sp. Nitz4//scaffold54_size114964//63917//65376//NITZ4_003854-RA/size114964-augustus-gene-0.6-mRNA-1//1//CDS//3329554360//7200//frame0